MISTHSVAKPLPRHLVASDADVPPCAQKPASQRIHAGLGGQMLKDYSRVTPEFWEAQANRRAFIDFLQLQLGGSFESLYSVTRRTIEQAGGGGLLQRYKGSPAALFIAEYPEHNWKRWLFAQSPRRYWTELGHRFHGPPGPGQTTARQAVADYLHSVANRHNIKDLREWESLVTGFEYGKVMTQSERLHFALLGGVRVVLATLHPTHQWNFGSTTPTILPAFSSSILPESFWKEAQNRANYWNFLKNQLGGTLEALYKLNIIHLIQSGGRGILRFYPDHSVPGAVMAAFPDHYWLPWKFRASPMRWWEALAVRYHNADPKALGLVETYISEIGAHLKVKQLSDWYRIGESRLGWKRTHLEPLGGLASVLEKIYPDHPWQRHLFKLRSKRSVQYSIYSLLQEKFPGKAIVEEVSPEALNWKPTVAGDHHPIIFDIAIPEEHLIVEYHGRLHYSEVFKSNEVQELKARDALKVELCKANGYALVVVPYWWDRQWSTLQSAIAEQCPHLFAKPRTT